MIPGAIQRKNLLKSRAKRVVCYTHQEEERWLVGYYIVGDPCWGCRGLRRAYTYTPAYQKRAERRRYWQRFSKAVATCGFSFAEFSEAVEATAAAMVRLRKAMPRRNITVARNARAGRE